MADYFYANITIGGQIPAHVFAELIDELNEYIKSQDVGVMPKGVKGWKNFLKVEKFVYDDVEWTENGVGWDNGRVKMHNHSAVYGQFDIEDWCRDRGGPSYLRYSAGYCEHSSCMAWWVPGMDTKYKEWDCSDDGDISVMMSWVKYLHERWVAGDVEAAMKMAADIIVEIPDIPPLVVLAKPGSTVIWNDPELGLLTGEYEVVDVNGEIYALKNKKGSEVECLFSEIEIPEEMSEK